MLHSAIKIWVNEGVQKLFVNKMRTTGNLKVKQQKQWIYQAYMVSLGHTTTYQYKCRP